MVLFGLTAGAFMGCGVILTLLQAERRQLVKQKRILDRFSMPWPRTWFNLVSYTGDLIEHDDPMPRI